MVGAYDEGVTNCYSPEHLAIYNRKVVLIDIRLRTLHSLWSQVIAASNRNVDKRTLMTIAGSTVAGASASLNEYDEPARSARLPYHA